MLITKVKKFGNGPEDVKEEPIKMPASAGNMSAARDQP
jgi:hypothetical protein